jgi:uncharacterized protein
MPGTVHLSRFVLTYEDVRPGEHVLYDIIKDHYVGVDDATLEGIKRWNDHEPSDGDEREVHDLLRDEGLLVDDPREDDERLRSFLEAAAEGMPGTLYITLMPTLVCNLACTYCFQKEHPAFNRMKEPVEASTVEWVLRKVDAAASRKLLVHYFGGEPLTRKDVLLRTAEIFHASMAARGGEFEWEITTNGLGLSVEFVREMLSFGPGTIKVTLDGDKETHDLARVYRSGKGSFDEIFKRTVEVTRACPGVKMRIGGNFRAEHVDSYERLLDRLEAAGLKGLLSDLRFKPIIDTGNDAVGTCTSCASADSETQTLVQLKTSVERRQLAQAPPSASLPSGPCELHWKNSYVIDPDGFVYKCPAVAGRPQMAITSVGAPAATRERVAPLLELRPWEQCGTCPFMPVCAGGCLGGQFLRTGRRDQVSCLKPRFETQFRSEITRRYLDEFGPESTTPHGDSSVDSKGESRHEEDERSNQQAELSAPSIAVPTPPVLTPY